MKTESEIRKLLKYLENIYMRNFEEDESGESYTSIFEDKKGKPEVLGGEAISILTNIHMAMRTLEWVLEQSQCYKYVEDEHEAELHKDKIMYDGDGKREIPDNSPEMLIAGLEGRW